MGAVLQVVRMKDTIITARRKKKELTIFAVCLAMAVLVNAACIISYKTSWTELFTQVGFTVVVAVMIYCIAAIARLLWTLVKKIFC